MRAARHGAMRVLIVATLYGCGGGRAPDAGGDAHTLNCQGDSDCDDGLFCDGAERCVEGECVLGAQVLCADDLDCTMDRCDEERRACVHDAPDEDGDGHTRVDCGGDDCDDADANRFPGNVEVCDAAKHDEDCDPMTFGFRDADGDGWPDADCCNLDAAGLEICGDDCDDHLPAAHPSEAESCDGVDNDCDGAVDEGVSTTFTVDADGDGHGAPGGETRVACFAPVGFAEQADDCDDSDATAHPGAIELCDLASPSVDEDCDGTANPPALCDCSSGDSRGCLLPGVCAAGTQGCVDGSWGACSVAPTAERCNGLDDDCDGSVDEGLTLTCFADADGDGVAASGSPAEARCPDAARAFVGGCPRGTTDRVPLGAANLDCDDTDPSRVPGAAETCDGVDNDCDGSVDEGATLRCFMDGDHDGYGVGSSSEVCPALGTSGCPDGLTANDPGVLGVDCDDADATRSPGASERCDGVDNDCDGSVDEEVMVSCFVDGDGDGFAATGAASTTRCAASPSAPCPAGETARAPLDAATSDCDDTNPLRSPSVLERCDHLDNDCDGAVDEGLRVMRYADADGDAFGAGPAVAVCPDEAGYADVDTDCDDARVEVFPGSYAVGRAPLCPAGSAPCDVLQGSLVARRGCMVGGSCRDDVAYWDYNCNGRRDLITVPFAAGSCRFERGGIVGASSCVQDSQCVGGGASWDAAIVGAPCGIRAPYRGCACVGTATGGPFGCGLGPALGGLAPGVECR